MSETPTIHIERMGYGPEAIGHLESGKAVFVSGAVPGDVVTVEILEEKKSFARAKVVSLVEASSLRAKEWQKLASDSAAMATCPWSLMTYEAQLDAKSSNVQSALLRTAHMDACEVEKVLNPIVPNGEQWGYRNKVELASARNSQGRIELGFHEPHSGAFVAAGEAILGNRLLRKSPKALQGALRYVFGSEDCNIYRVGVRASMNTESVEVALWTPPGPFPRSFAAKVLVDAVGATSIVRVLADEGSARKVRKVEVLHGDGFWRERMKVSGKSYGYRISAPSFFQVNTQQAQMLVKLAIEGLGGEDALGAMMVADLYAGAGTFSIPIASAGARVVAIELEGSSSRDFRRNAELCHVDAEMVCDDVARALPSIGRMDACVVDPPRAGLDGRVVRQIAKASPAKVAYVSCDPQTLARDISRFASEGYAPSSITPVDMFPQTYHTECVCLFARV